MEYLVHLKQTLGPMAIPLMGCAALTLLLMLERLLALLIASARGSLIRRGRAMLDAAQGQDKSAQEALATLWLKQQRRHLASGIRLLQILAMVAPLLGLLGTVLGLITVFEALAAHQGPVTPALLANGLGVAMQTTAAGLAIAVPAMLGAHGFQLWADALVHVCERDLNIRCLQRQGVCVEVLS